MPTRLALIAFAAALPVAAQSIPLIPAPREVKPGATLPLTSGLRINCQQPCDAEDTFAIADLKAELTARGIATTDSPTAPHILVTRYNTPLGKQTYTDAAHSSAPSEDWLAEGYAIVPDQSSPQDAGLALTANSATGIFYALQTVKQLVIGSTSSAKLQLATIRDWPAMKYRGVHDDLSRGPIPTLEFQKHFIHTLASYKVNTYSPYFEHTQQYAANPLFAPPGGSMSAADARELVAYASQFHVTIIPEQEAFGHLHRNLYWEQYLQIAETPHGDVLAPGQPGSLQLINQMFTELAQLYPGPFLHIGADETQNLGTGQTKSAVDTRGLGPVYLDFMQQIVTNLQPLHRRILFWGDIAQTIVQGGSPYGVAGPDRTDPQILQKLPASFKHDTIAVAWMYDPAPRGGFAKFLTPFTTAGFETWVAPGVNNWGRVWPDNNDALPNIQQFIAEGQRQHSTGTLNTIWYDDGEALANSNWYGLLFGAAAAWQSGVSSIPDFQQSFGPVFHGDQTGDLDQAQIELMKCHEILRSAKVGDGSDGLFWMDPWSKDGVTRANLIRPVVHDLRLHAEAALTLIAKARAAYPAVAPTLYSPTNILPSNPTSLRNTDALDAMELGARKLDFIGLKFQLADEIATDYSNALIAQSSADKKIHRQLGSDINDIVSFIGRIRDLRDNYALLRDLYQQSWLRSNRPYALQPNLIRYDEADALWASRQDALRTLQRLHADGKLYPPASDLGIPPAPPTTP